MRADLFPPPYPRIPHLPPAPAATRTDSVLDTRDAARLLAAPVRVEEKLDGANVALWLEADGSIGAATRGGADALDRGGQRGSLRAWAYQRTSGLQTVLAGGTVLYAEWLWLQHGLAYESLPDFLVGFDLWTRGQGFAPVAERDARLSAAGIALPPSLGDLPVEGMVELDALAERSAFRPGPAEGVVVRRLAADPEAVRVAKRVRPGFARVRDDAWDGAARNRLAPAAQVTRGGR